MTNIPGEKHVESRMSVHVAYYTVVTLKPSPWSLCVALRPRVMSVHPGGRALCSHSQWHCALVQWCTCREEVTMRALSDLGQWELKCRSYALKCSEFRLVIKFDVLFSKVASFAEWEETCSSLKMDFSWMIFENYFFVGNVYVFIFKNCL